MKTLITFFSVIIAIMISSCSNQRVVTAETDDIYFTERDRAASQTTNVTVIQPEPAPEFQGAAANDDGYFIKGTPKQGADTTGDVYYSEDEAARYSSTSSDGTTINNFYGTTNYYEGDQSMTYATRLRRFNSNNVVVGYSYYDPFFMDPYWNYGWTYWDPYWGGTPAWSMGWGPSWYVGWNSWYGWNAGYNWGWGPRWNRWGPYYGSAYWDPNWGGRPYGNYWSGYNRGYWDGWGDAMWYGDAGRSTTVTSRRWLANESGFVSNSGSRQSNNPNRDIADKVSDRPVGIVDREVVSPTQRNTMSASAERLNKTSKLYQVNNPAVASRVPASDVRKSTVANQGGSALKDHTTRTNIAPVNDRSKYNASELARTPRTDHRYGATRTMKPERAVNSVNPTNSASPSNSRVDRPAVPINSGRGQENGRTPNQVRNTTPSRSSGTNRDHYYRSPERQQQDVGTQRRPVRVETPASSPNNGRDRSPNYQRYEQKTSSYPSRSRTYEAPSGRDRSPSAAPSRGSSPSRNTYSTPSRSSSPSRTYSPPSSPSRGSRSSGGSFNRPSRSSGSSGGSFSSPSRGSSSPNRSGGGRR